MKQSKKDSKEWIKYIEAVLYSVVLIALVVLCLKNNIYINMIPIALIIGVLGQVTLGKRVMTSFFVGVLTIVLLQMKNGQTLGLNLLVTLKITILCLIGELLGWSGRRLYRILKGSKKNNKKIKREKITCIVLVVFSTILGLGLNSYFNGNFIEYLKAKDSLEYYLGEKYHSISRFKIVNVRREFSFNTRYLFTTEDVLSNNVQGKFSVYLKDMDNVQDEYLEQLNNKKVNEMNEKLENVKTNENTQLIASLDGNDLLNLDIYKTVENVSVEEVETYAQEITKYMESILKIENYKDIEKIKIYLKSSKDEKQNIASEIYMDGYDNMLEMPGSDPVYYIVNALNIEYIDM